jgi:hypothetical protein
MMEKYLLNNPSPTISTVVDHTDTSDTTFFSRVFVFLFLVVQWFRFFLTFVFSVGVRNSSC